MSSSRKPSGLLQQNYDKIILVVVLAAILISGLLLALQLNNGSAMKPITEAVLASTAPIATPPLDDAMVNRIDQIMSSPRQIAAAQRRMMVGDLRVSSVPDGLPIPFDALVCPFTSNAQPAIIRAEERDSDGDGIPDVWEEKYGLNPFDPGDAAMDKDADGFSNLEEHIAKTEPTDDTDFPPPSAKLRLVRVQVNPFKLRFLGLSSLPNGDTVYQLNLRTLERTYFPRMNDEVEGFTVVGYDEKAAEGPTLTLQQGDKTIKLVRGRVRDEQAYTALMIFLVDGKRYKANLGETIVVLDRNYKVVDIKENHVVIRDEESGRNIEIGLISAEERQKLTKPGLGGVAP
jgi:hypothetical protein